MANLDLLNAYERTEGPLHGVAIAVKDVFDVEGVARGNGNPESKAGERAGELVTREQHDAALAKRAELLAACVLAHATVDVLVSPAAPYAAPPRLHRLTPRMVRPKVVSREPRVALKACSSKTSAEDSTMIKGDQS